MLKMTNENYEKPCPTCDKVIKYKTKTSLSKSVRLNRSCKNCSLSKIHPEKQKELIHKIKVLYEKGESVSSIGRILGFSRDLIAKYLKISSPELVGLNFKSYEETKILCKSCNKEKSIKKYQYGRKGKKHQYRFLFCNECRNSATRRRNYSSIENYIKFITGNLAKRTKLNNIDFDLDYEFLINLYKKQEGRCFYTDVLLKYGLGKQMHQNQFSIDRVYFDRGYTKDNVVLCSNRVNTIKNNLTINEMKQWLPFWYYRLKRKGYLKDV